MAIYKHYNQQQLDSQYNNRLHIPDYAAYFERWESLSRKAAKEHTIFKDISFGKHPEECLDIFPAATPFSKTLVFIHGGYWHLLDKVMFHFLAPTFLKYNVTTVFINYPLAPTASMDMIVSSCHKAMSWISNNINLYNGDPSQLYVAGHSAGGHLASMLMANNDLQSNQFFLKGVISISGLFRLEPLMLSNLNSILQMDTVVAKKNSPVYYAPDRQCPLLLAVGTNETDEFKEQSSEMYKSWKDKHDSIELLNIPGKNHFSILDTITENGSSLQMATLGLMNLL